MNNEVLRNLRSGKAVTSIWLVTGSMAAAELVATAAPDAVVFDDQHGLWDRYTLYAAISAVRDRTVALVRTSNHSHAAIGSALDSGALGVIVPMIESGAQAAAAVAAAQYPPSGQRSGGGVRPLINFPDYVAAAARELLVGVMIETAEGVDKAAEIVNTPGVDLVFIGSGDLALSLGTFPEFGPVHEKAVQKILALCKEVNVPCGIYCVQSSEGPERVAQGFQFLFLGSDNDFLRKGAVAALAAMTVRERT